MRLVAVSLVIGSLAHAAPVRPASGIRGKLTYSASGGRAPRTPEENEAHKERARPKPMACTISAELAGKKTTTVTAADGSYNMQLVPGTYNLTFDCASKCDTPPPANATVTSARWTLIDFACHVSHK